MAAEFPFPSVSSNNPPPLYFQMEPEEFIVGKTIYDDGGADYHLQHGGVGVKRCAIKYDGLNPTWAAILDAHLVSTFYSADEGSAVGFNIRDPKTGTLYANAHYAPGGYKKSHTKDWIHAREILIEIRP